MSDPWTAAGFCPVVNEDGQPCGREVHDETVEHLWLDRRQVAEVWAEL